VMKKYFLCAMKIFFVCDENIFCQLWWASVMKIFFVSDDVSWKFFSSSWKFFLSVMMCDDEKFFLSVVWCVWLSMVMCVCMC
jgi:hypothetical protein